MLHPEAKLTHEPWTHLQIDNFMPENDFRLLREQGDVLANDAKSWTGYKERYAVPLEEFDADAISYLIGDEWKHRLCDIFADQIGARGHDLGRIKRNGYWKAMMCYDKETYEIAPHVDVKSKIITTLLYLAPDGVCDPKRGTGLYTNRSWKSRVGQADYKPNSFFAFVPLDNTWHGVEKVESGKSRMVANVTLYLPKEKH